MNTLGYNTQVSALQLASLAFMLTVGSVEPDDQGFVRIEASQGEVTQRPPEPMGQHYLRLEVELHSRLPIESSDFELEVVLLYEGREIPGWRLTQRYESTRLLPQTQMRLDLSRVLARQRRNIKLPKIQYRVRLLRYRLNSVNLDLMVRLLESPHSADQAAAISSLVPPRSEVLIRSHLETTKQIIQKELARELKSPTARDALRLLLALRAVSKLGLVSLLDPVVSWFSVQDQELWGRAIVDLAHRLVSESNRNEVRVGLLPQWARSSLTHDHRVPRALQDVIFGCITRQGDKIIPELVLLAHRHRDSKTGAAATKILEAMGRSQPAQQLALEKEDNRVRMIQVMGELKQTDAIDELIRLLESPRVPTVTATVIALRTMGRSSVPALVKVLGRDDTRSRKMATKSLVDILRERPALKTKLSKEHDISLKTHVSLEQFVEALARNQNEQWKRALSYEIDAALSLAESGNYEEGFKRLNQIYVQSPRLYMKRADRISTVYLSHAEALYLSGNFDEAKHAARSALQLDDSRNARSIYARISLALAEGMIELGLLGQAQVELESIDPAVEDLARHSRLRLITKLKMARLALARGDYARARAQTDRAHAINPDDAQVQSLYMQLLVLENLVPIGVLAVLVLALALALVVRLRNRYSRHRFVRIQSQIDQVSELSRPE